jgi:hypothetical protein
MHGCCKPYDFPALSWLVYQSQHLQVASEKISDFFHISSITTMVCVCVCVYIYNSFSLLSSLQPKIIHGPNTRTRLIFMKVFKRTQYQN